jgi:metallophosphoesterase (TIGR00282 family)
MKILFIGDVIGRPGRSSVRSLLPALKAETGAEVVIANGENCAGGIGITGEKANELFDGGVDLLTTGNHVWKKKEVYDYLSRSDRVVRPANYPPGVPGHGSLVFTARSGAKVGLLNLLGRVFAHEALDCPFRAADRELESLRRVARVIIVDVHAEATSEKRAIGHHLDGSVTAVLGTHTHVQTADEEILPGGTGYITDVGMAGPVDSVIGMRKEMVLQRFKLQMPAQFQVASGNVILDAVALEADEKTGRCVSIRRIRRKNA